MSFIVLHLHFWVECLKLSFDLSDDVLQCPVLSFGSLIDTMSRWVMLSVLDIRNLGEGYVFSDELKGHVLGEGPSKKYLVIFLPPPPVINEHTLNTSS